ncbi:hypothetical protein O6H91_Y503000 [Diphasiastrum complanatum]|nr:hypothetical protein O6H91_Y503000 [Diphasiastrum complanatum]
MAGEQSSHDVWQDNADLDDEAVVDGVSLPGGLYSASASEEMEREWRARKQQFETLGYRDGVTEGKKFSAQEGFNSGFQVAAAAGFNWGVARGLTSAFAGLPAHVREIILKEVDSRTRLEALHSTVASISTNDALRLYYQDFVVSATPKDRSNPEQNDASSIEEPLPLANEYTAHGTSGNICSTSVSGELPSQLEAVGSGELGASLVQTSEVVTMIGDFSEEASSEPAVSPESSHQSNKLSASIGIPNGVDFQVHDKGSTERSGKSIGPRSHSGLDLDSRNSFAQMSISDNHKVSPLRIPLSSLRSLVDFQKEIRHEFELASLMCPTIL